MTLNPQFIRVQQLDQVEELAGADTLPVGQGADQLRGASLEQLRAFVLAGLTEMHDGADGRTLLNGAGPPVAELGQDGDFYISAEGMVYGPKAVGAWPSGRTLVGRSAYESAVEQGFEGSEAEWIESISAGAAGYADAALAARDEAVAARNQAEGFAASASDAADRAEAAVDNAGPTQTEFEDALAEKLSGAAFAGKPGWQLAAGKGFAVGDRAAGNGELWFDAEHPVGAIGFSNFDYSVWGAVGERDADTGRFHIRGTHAFQFAATPYVGAHAIYHAGNKPAKGDVGLGNVNNTSDADKPVSTAQALAIGGKAPIDHDHAIADVEGLVDALADKAAASALAGKENAIAPGTTAQYFRGDKSWQALTKAAVALGNVDNTSDANKPVSTAQQSALNGKVDTSTRGQPNGVATLDSGGKVPATQLPSYVDDVLEYANLAAFPASGETGKIYIAVDGPTQYRWSGSAYQPIVASPGSTDAVPEGGANQYFTEARVRATPATGLVATAGTPAAGDSILTILGKLLKGFFTDHAGAGGGVHAEAVANGAAGFLSGTDKAKIDAVQAQLDAKAPAANPVFQGTPTDDINGVNMSGTAAVVPNDGSWHNITLTGNWTPNLAGLAPGQGAALAIDDGAGYSITWSAVNVWQTDSGTAPVLKTTGDTHVVLFNDSGVIKGWRAGDGG